MEQTYKEFKRTLDVKLAHFIEENMTYENKKTLTDFTIMDFIKWVSEKEKKEND